MAFRRRAPALRRRAPFKKRSTKRVAKLSKPIKAAINRVVHGNVETKYVAQALQVPNGTFILNAFHWFYQCYY